MSLSCTGCSKASSSSKRSKRSSIPFSPGCRVTGLRRVSGSLTNAVFFVTVGNIATLLLRVYEIGSDAFIDISSELFWLNRLAHLKLDPRLLAIFGNGRFEEYLPSTILTHTDLHVPLLSAQIARRFRQLHDLIDAYPPAPSDHLAVRHNVDRWLDVVEHSSLYDFHRLRREIDQCKALLKDTRPRPSSLPITITVMVLVDFEYAGYDHHGFDITNHFVEWMYHYHGNMPALMCPDTFPTPAQQIRFLEDYANGDDNLANALLTESRRWFMAAHLHWGLWCLVQAGRSEIEFDYISYALERLDASIKSCTDTLANNPLISSYTMACFLWMIFTQLSRCHTIDAPNLDECMMCPVLFRSAEKPF